MPQRPDLPVSGSTITTAWGTTVRDQIVTPFSTSGVRDGEIGSPVGGQVTTLTATNTTNGVYVWNGLSWRPPWNMPYGYAAISAVPGSYTFSATLSYSSTFTWSAVDNRNYRVTFAGEFQPGSVGPTILSTSLYAGTTALSTLAILRASAEGAVAPATGMVNPQYACSTSFVYASTATGTQTWRFGSVGSAGSGSMTFVPHSVIIEDIGPNGAPVA
jgi:hypothetical protein